MGGSAARIMGGSLVFFTYLAARVGGLSLPGVSLSHWQVLGPFPLGKTELDGLPRGPAPSELLPGGIVNGWAKLRTDADGTIGFPGVD